MRTAQTALSPAASQRLRAAAQELCGAIEVRMDELIELVERETSLVREGKLFALKELEPRKARAAREFITGLEAVKKIRPALDDHAPDSIYRLRRRHAEFRAMLQLSLAALATARNASDEMLEAISAGRGLGDSDMPGYTDLG